MRSKGDHATARMPMLALAALTRQLCRLGEQADRGAHVLFT